MIEPQCDGLILVGGKSSRMRTPKALLSLTGIPQWQACERALRAVCREVFFSVSKSQTFSLPVAPTFLIHDVFCEPCGPIGGILSGFKQQKNRALFVLACDMPHFNQEAAQFLLSARDGHKKATIFVNEDDDVEPLCGIYEPSIFMDLLEAWANDERCARKLLNRLPVKRVRPTSRDWLKNVNSPDDWQTNEPSKKISLTFYAGLKEQAHCNDLEITTHAKTVGEIYNEISLRFNFLHDQTTMRFAKNHRLVSEETVLDDGDTIVFIPPVSGG